MIPKYCVPFDNILAQSKTMKVNKLILAISTLSTCTFFACADSVDNTQSVACDPNSTLCADNNYQLSCDAAGSDYSVQLCEHGCNSETNTCNPAPADTDTHTPQNAPGIEVKPECQEGDAYCSGQQLHKCLDGRYYDFECTEDMVCDPESQACVLVSELPDSTCDSDTFEPSCDGNMLTICLDDVIVRQACDSADLCDAEHSRCLLPEPPSCGDCADDEFCDEKSQTCMPKECDLDDAPKCVNGLAYKSCDNWQYKIHSCGDGLKCKYGQCYDPNGAEPQPQPDPDPQPPVTPQPDPGETGTNAGYNCPAGQITVSDSELKTFCVLDPNEPLGEVKGKSQYYCTPGAIEGRYCRTVPAENPDSRVSMKPGQKCTEEQLNPASNTLRVHIIDVGQGDSIWIQTPTGQNVLIDGGDTGAFGTAGGPIVHDYLTFHGFPAGSEFDAVFLTHPHSDHYGGLTNIFNKDKDTKKVKYAHGMKNYIDPMEPQTTEDVPTGYVNWIKKVHKYLDSSHIYMPAEDMFSTTTPMPEEFFGTEAKAYFIRSTKKLTNAAGKAANNNRASIMFQLTYAGRSFMFTGDAETEQEAEAISKSPDHIASNFLKVCHHGSPTSSSVKFLDAVWNSIPKADRYALISSGRGKFSGTYIPAVPILDRLMSYLEPDHLYSTSVGDDDKTESEAYRDDNILIVVKPDGDYYACYAGTN